MADAGDELKTKNGLPSILFAHGDDQVRIRTERYRQLYANNMQLGFSTWDLGITFGEIVGEKDGKPVVEETVKILMTREIGKILATLLQTHFALFEAQFGEIKLPVAEHKAMSSEAKKRASRKSKR
jgi:hypothetical protein